MTDLTHSVRRTEKKLQDCFSFKGEDFCCEANRPYVKDFTKRARRRLNKAIVRAEALQDHLD